MTVSEMIAAYEIKLAEGDRLSANISHLQNQSEVFLEIKRMKPEIVAELHSREEAAKEREAKIAALEGLNELTALRSEWERYHLLFSDHFCAGNRTAFPYERPTMKLEDAEKQYPRAAAYLKAMDFSVSPDADKAQAGLEAVEAILDGEDCAEALFEMGRKWSEAVAERNGVAQPKSQFKNRPPMRVTYPAIVRSTSVACACRMCDNKPQRPIEPVFYEIPIVTPADMQSFNVDIGYFRCRYCGAKLPITLGLDTEEEN